MSALQGWVSNPHETRQALVEGVFWSLLAASSVFLGLRLWIRANYGRWQPDDYVLVFSWLCQVCFVTITHVQVSLGFGKHALDIPFKNINGLAVNGAAGLTVSIIGMAAAKVSFGITLLKLTSNLWRWSNWVIWFMIVTLVATAVPAAVLPWCLCTPIAKTFVSFIPGQCIDKTHSVRYGVFQAGYSGLVDFLFALLPWKVLWGLKMRPVEKFGIGIAMSLGAIAGVMAVMRGLTLDELAVQDVAYDGTFAVIWAEVEFATITIAACIPILRKMIADEVSTRGKGGSGKGSSLFKNSSSQPRSGHDRNPVAVPTTAPPPPPRRPRGSNIHPLVRLSLGGIGSGSMGSLSLSHRSATGGISVGGSRRWYSVHADDESQYWRDSVATREDIGEHRLDQRHLSLPSSGILGEDGRSGQVTTPQHIYFQMRPLR